MIQWKIMFAIVFISLLTLQSAYGIYLFPASWRNPPQNVTNLAKTEGNKTHSAPEAKMYFENFDLNKLNPVYWFYDSTEDDKVDELYNLVKCLIEEEEAICQKKLQSTRKLFEKKKKGDKDNKDSTAVHADNSIDHNVDSNTHRHHKVKQWRKKVTPQQPVPEDKLKSKTSTVQPSEKKTTQTSAPSFEEAATTTLPVES